MFKNFTRSMFCFGDQILTSKHIYKEQGIGNGHQSNTLLDMFDVMKLRENAFMTH